MSSASTDEVALASLRRVGLVLIVLGLLDLAIMAVCISRRVNYSSSLNLFVLIPGIFMFRGSTRAGRLMRLYTGFLLGAVAFMLLASPLLAPLELLILWMRLNPGQSMLTIVGAVALLVALGWVYRALCRPFVLGSAALGRFSLVAPPGVGAALVSLVVVLVSGMGESSTGARVRQEAERKLGPGFKYFVSTINSRTIDQVTRVTGRAIAYDDHQIVPVDVAWTE